MIGPGLAFTGKTNKLVILSEVKDLSRPNFSNTNSSTLLCIRTRA